MKLYFDSNKILPILYIFVHFFCTDIVNDPRYLATNLPSTNVEYYPQYKIS